MDHHPKSKKALLLERNRKFQRLNQHAEQHQAETDAIRDAEAGLQQASSAESSTGEAPIWSEKLQTIRLRNGSRKTRARGMWDRFATGGGGMAR